MKVSACCGGGVSPVCGGGARSRYAACVRVCVHRRVCVRASAVCVRASLGRRVCEADSCWLVGDGCHSKCARVVVRSCVCARARRTRDPDPR